MPDALKTKPPLGRLLLLAFLLAAATAYQLRAAAFREPHWFGINAVWRPFYLGEDDHKISFLIAATRAAGLNAGDQLLTVNGRPVKGKAVFGEEVSKAHPGDVMRVTVLRKSPRRREAEMDFAIPLVSLPHFPLWPRIQSAILIIFLPYVSVLVGFWVAAARPRDALAWLVLALLSSYLGFFDTGAEQWGRYARDAAVVFRAAANFGFPAFLLLFGIYFPGPFPRASRWSRWERMKWFLIAPLALSGLMVIAGAVGWMENAASVAWLDRLPYVQVVAQVLVYVSAASAVLFLAVKYRSAVSIDGKRRLRLLTAGSLICFAPFFLLKVAALIKDVNPELYFPEWLWFGAYVLFFLFPLVLAYVIVVHRAMDVRVVLRQGMQYALAKGGVLVIQALIALAAIATTLALMKRSRGIWPFIFLALGMGAFLGIRQGADKLRRWIDRRFFREAYNAEQVLSELSDQVRSMVEPQSLLRTVATRISETLHVPQIAVLLDSGSPFRPAYALGYPSLGDVTFAQDSTTVKVLQARKEPVRMRLDDPGWLRRDAGQTEAERASLEQLRPELLLPLAGRDKLLGFITLGAKRSEEPFTGNDLRLLKSVANQTGLALENAQLMAAITEEVAQRERLNREVEIAREVQERLFPQALPPIVGLDYCGACQPALGVGGDYYDFLALPDGKLGIAIGDVSGKGIAAALMMASLEASLRAEATRAPGDLAALVTNVNRLVYQASTSNRYATFFYAQYEPKQRQLTYVNAGHNPPILLRRQAQGYQVSRLTAGGTVVGLLESFPYQQETLTMQPGDLLVAFTDGISEAMNPQEEEFGEDRLIEVLQAGFDLPAASVLSSIMQAAGTFAAGAKQFDDMTLVVMRTVAHD